MFVQNEFKKIGDFLNNTLETAAERRHAFFNYYNNNKKKIKRWNEDGEHIKL